MSGKGDPQTTALTPNTNCVATPLGNFDGNATTVQFVVPASPTPCWEVEVSAPQATQKLSDDYVCGNVTLQAGLTVRSVGRGDSRAYVIILTGTIVDGQQSYPYSENVIYDSEEVTARSK